MAFSSFGQAQSALLWGTFGIAVVMGATANKTNFCTMGAVSDWVNMGDTGRLRAWLLAIAVAMVGVAALEYLGYAKPGAAFPPYRGTQLLWGENLVGGLLFGIGMTLGSGCGNKTLVRLGGGNLKSLVVLVVIGVVAWFMVHPFPGTDQTLMSLLFLRWLRPLSLSLSSPQDLASLMAGQERVAAARLILGAGLGLLIAAFALRSAEFRRNANNVLGGLVIGWAVVAGWYVSSNIAVHVDGEDYTLQEFVAEQWDMLAAPQELKPAEARPLSPQSFSFINPMGQSLGWAASGFDRTLLTAGVMAVVGVILGSLFWSVVSRGFRVEWFASGRDFVNHLIGAVLMGFGGILAMGCTIGQGITGVSTLALGSFLTLGAIVLGAALAMKVTYYRMAYEQASFLQALIAALADLRLVPASLRQLEPG